MNGVSWARHRGAFDLDECGECPECLIIRAQGRHK